MNEQDMADTNRFASVVAEVERAVAEVEGDLSGQQEFPSIEDVMPESDLLRQADLLDALRPRALREVAVSTPGSSEGRSTIAALRSKAYLAAMGIAKPLRDELERILDYADAVAVAYRLVSERVSELEDEIARMREGSGPEG